MVAKSTAAKTAPTAAPVVTPATAAPAAPVGYQFEDIEEVTAAREPNPFDAVVASLEVGSAKGKAFTIKGNADTTTSEKGAKTFKNKELRTIRRQLTDAGDALTPQVTVRMVPKTIEVDGEQYVRVQIKAVKKIQHVGE